MRAKHIAVSNFTAKCLKKLGVKDAIVIPNGVDLEFIESIKPSENKWDIVFAGRLIKEKGVDEVLKIVANLLERGVKAKTLVIGDGPEKEKVKKLAKELDILDLVCFKEFVPQKVFLFHS